MSLSKIADSLNEIIILGADTWESILLSMISPYAPRILINGVETRANLHCLLCGDVSSAKSKILEICKKISPAWQSISKTSESSLEGSAVRKDIEPGILEKCSPGNLIVNEFARALETHTGILREALDCTELRIFKKGSSRIFTPNVSVMAACNPTDDFFLKGLEMRSQVSFKEGMLSRFDVLIPTLASQELNEAVLNRIVLFGYSTCVNWKTLYHFFSQKSKVMLKVKEVQISEEQQQRLKETFRKHNKRILRFRPFLILRDLETLARLVNVITTFETDSTGVVNATNLGLDVAIGIWEHLLSLREEFYTERNRRVLTIPQQIIQILNSNGGISKVEDVKKDICETKNLCSPATFYRKIQRLEESGKIKHKKGKQATIKINLTGSVIE